MGLLLSLIALMAGGAAAYANRKGRVARPVLLCLSIAVIGFGLVLQHSYSLLFEGQAVPEGLPISAVIGMVGLILGLTLSVALLIGRALHKRASWVAAMILGGLFALIIVIGLFIWTL